jgi:UTP-glucose-1-phosphate uridylyltransferase
MPDNTPAPVVVAAGGLGTRVHGWAQFIPKEFYPVGGRPGIINLLEEIADLGADRVAIVYHPYYERFAAWGRQVLSSCDHGRYTRETGLSVPVAVPQGMTVSLIPQHGPYGDLTDLTSVFNGADSLAARESLYVAFADNLYPGASPLRLLRDTPEGGVAVLASAYRQMLAPSRGVLITRPGYGNELRQVRALVEKPDPAGARALEEEHGTENLLMLEGRAKLTAEFIQFARGHQHAPGGEPRLSMAIGAYAREHRVVAIPADMEVVDLGALAAPAPWVGAGCGLPAVPAPGGAEARGSRSARGAVFPTAGVVGGKIRGNPDA